MKKTIKKKAARRPRKKYRYQLQLWSRPDGKWLASCANPNGGPDDGAFETAALAVAKMDQMIHVVPYRVVRKEIA